MFLLATAIAVWLTALAIDAAAVRTSSPLFTASSSGIPAPPQNTSSIPALVETAYTFLKSHLCTGRRWGYNYHFYRPSLQKYSADQWLWDSGSHQIVWSHRNASNAVLSLRSLLHLQAVDGRVPEMVSRGTWYCLYGIALTAYVGRHIDTPPKYGQFPALARSYTNHHCAVFSYPPSVGDCAAQPHRSASRSGNRSRLRASRMPARRYFGPIGQLRRRQSNACNGAL